MRSRPGVVALRRWPVWRPGRRPAGETRTWRRSPAAQPGRRAFLLGAGLTAAAVVGGGALARLLDTRAGVVELRAQVPLPPVRRPARGVVRAAALPVEGVAPVLTPTRGFYRIDSALRVPQVDVRDWSLTVDGMVDRPLVLRWEELLARATVEADITMQCVSNPVGGQLVGTVRWQGVRLADLPRTPACSRARTRSWAGRSTASRPASRRRWRSTAGTRWWRWR